MVQPSATVLEATRADRKSEVVSEEDRQVVRDKVLGTRRGSPFGLGGASEAAALKQLSQPKDEAEEVEEEDKAPAGAKIAMVDEDGKATHRKNVTLDANDVAAKEMKKALGVKRSDVLGSRRGSTRFGDPKPDLPDALKEGASATVDGAATDESVAEVLERLDELESKIDVLLERSTPAASESE